MRFVPALLLVTLLAACGQTGDLYLPNKTPPPSTPSQDQQPKKQPAPPATTLPAPPQPN